MSFNQLNGFNGSGSSTTTMDLPNNSSIIQPTLTITSPSRSRKSQEIQESATSKTGDSSVSDSRPDSGIYSMSSSPSHSMEMEVDTKVSIGQQTMTITASVKESPRFSRKKMQTAATLSVKPGDAPVTANVIKNEQGDLVAVPTHQHSSICHNGVDGTSSVLATMTIGELNDNKFTGQPIKPQQISSPPNKPKPAVEKTFQIFINFFKDSKNHTFDVMATFRVEKLKTMIEERLGVPPEQQKLTYAGKNLEHGMMLSHYNIRECSTVYLTGRLRGG